MKPLHSRIIVLGLLLIGPTSPRVCAEPSAKQTERNSPTVSSLFSYPLNIGQLSFPKDEGKHSPSEWPNTLAEWHAHYAHLTAEDGTRYFLFTTFVTFDPVEQIIGGKFPHTIATLVDVTHGKTYHHRDMSPLKIFAFDHADVQTTHGDYFRWRGMAKPFQYDFHVAWRGPLGNIAVSTELKMTKPPLVVNGSGYIKLPKGDSGYYCQSRLETKGDLTIKGVTKKVSGVHWIDRQWLGMTFAGNLNYYYDWWALQLDNNEEAVLFRIKDFATNAVAMSVLEINHADGKREHVDEFVLTDLPSGWQLSAPAAGWELKIIPATKDQTTWQSCDVTGTIHGKPVTGLAAAELARDALEEFRKALLPSPGAKAAAESVEASKSPTAAGR